VRFRAFGESSLDFELLVWIDEPVLRGQTQDALLTAIYKRFQTEGIEIPYPKRDVYVRELPVRRDVEAS
jgi:small-conductance mechanosensitive channel